MLVTREDAAVTQLSTSIRMHLMGLDPISVHTVASAAHALLNDILGARKLPTAYDDLRPYVYPDKYDYAVKKLKEAEVFFKHGRTGKDTIKFEPDSTTFTMFFSIYLVERLGLTITPEMRVFRFAFYMQHSDILLEPHRTEMHELSLRWPNKGLSLQQQLLMIDNFGSIIKDS